MKIAQITIITILLGMNTLLADVQLSKHQLDNLKKIYKMGEPHDLGNTLVGIAWVESKLGIYKIGALSSDFGIMQVNIKTLLRRLDVKDTPMNRSKYATKLVELDWYCTYYAIKELEYWKSKNEGWVQIVSHYNQGTVVKSMDYVRKVSKAIKELKPYLEGI